jgi:hypothetical protein
MRGGVSVQMPDLSSAYLERELASAAQPCRTGVLMKDLLGNRIYLNQD